jgi:hypothetical protein
VQNEESETRTGDPKKSNSVDDQLNLSIDLRDEETGQKAFQSFPPMSSFETSKSNTSNFDDLDCPTSDLHPVKNSSSPGPKSVSSKDEFLFRDAEECDSVNLDPDNSKDDHSELLKAGYRQIGSDSENNSAIFEDQVSPPEFEKAPGKTRHLTPDAARDS